MDTEFALAESEPDFKSIVEGIADVIWTAEVDGALHYLSPQFKTMFGLEPEDWIGRSPYELVHPCLLYTSPSPRDRTRSRMPSSA